MTRPNFLDWVRNLKIVLKLEKFLYILDEATPEVPLGDSPTEAFKAYNQHKDAEEMATCLMLVSMSPKLQRQYEDMNAHNILLHLQELFGV